MDPNAALAVIRKYLARYNDKGTRGLTTDDACEFFDHVEALVGWLDHGGFLPSDWHHKASLAMIRRLVDSAVPAPLDSTGQAMVTMRQALIEKARAVLGGTEFER